MCADNNLSTLALENIEQMKNASLSQEQNLIVYIDSKNQLPQLIKINNHNVEVVKTYIEHNSADSLILNFVLSDIIALYPSDSYGLVLWSHGSSWLPPYNYLRSFGSDNTNEMDIISMVNVLPIKFEYIIFDACLMGGIEVVFQFRNKANYILASPTDIISSGFPYDKITKNLFSKNIDSLISIASTYYEHYNNFDGKYKTASIALIDTKELDYLAVLNKKLIENNHFEIWEYKHEFIQPLYYFDQENVFLFDYMDFLQKNFNEDSIIQIKEQLNKTVLYNSHTEKILDILEINTFCGLNCYVPIKKYGLYNQYYQKLDWCSASGFAYLFE